MFADAGDTGLKLGDSKSPHHAEIARLGLLARGRVWALVALMAMIGLLGLCASAAALGASAETANHVLPAGTTLYLRLVTPISTVESHLNQTVTAHVVREVEAGNQVVVPLGAVLAGRLDRLIPSSSPTDRARVRVIFGTIELAGAKPLPVSGRVTEVGNARESVLADGTVQGVLASELPVSRLDDALAKLGKSRPELAGEIDQAAGKNIGKPDTAIRFPAGTDLEFTLDKPLSITQVFPPAAASSLDPQVAATIAQLLNGSAPNRSQSKDGKPGDPLNLIVIGNVDGVRQAFEQAGWSEAAERNSRSIWRTVRAVMGDEGYGQAPVSDLYLYERPEDLAFEKTLDTFTKRHHLRLWRTPLTTPDGRTIWFGASTHDIGFDVHPGVASHSTDPDLDAERSKVGADLLVTGHVAAEQLVTRPDPLTEGTTATGGAWHTDGRLLAIELKP